MPLKDGRLTKGEVAFSRAYAGTGDKTYAATVAGYAMPAESAAQVLARPAVQESIKRRQMARLARHVAAKTHFDALLTAIARDLGDKTQDSGMRGIAQ